MTTIAQEYIQEGIQLGLKQGIEQGRMESLQDNIVDLLAIRLGEVNEAVEERIRAVTSTTLLRQLLREAATAVSMTAFVQKLSDMTEDA